MSSRVVSANCALSAAIAFKIVMNDILRCSAFDAEKLSALVAPLGLRRKDRTRRELELIEHLTPVSERLAQGRRLRG